MRFSPGRSTGPAFALLVAGAALVLGAPRALAQDGDTLYVDPRGGGSHRSLRAALERAGGGSVIVVAPGRYRENLVVRRDVVIEGDGPAGEVVIDGGGKTTIEVRGADVELRGLTVVTRGGDRAINVINGSRALIENCQVSGGRHAAIRTVESRSTIRNCVVQGARNEGINYAHAAGTVEFSDVHQNGTYGIRVEGRDSQVVVRESTVHQQRGQPVVAENNRDTVVEDCLLDAPPGRQVVSRGNTIEPNRFIERVAGAHQEFIGP